MYAPIRARGLLALLVALAVGALVHGGTALMGAHLNGGQTAVVHVLAVVGAVGDGSLDGRIGGAGAPVVGTGSVHGFSSRKKEKSGRKA